MPTPPDPEKPPAGPPLEPIRVQRPRSVDALAELMREFRPDPVTFQPLTAASAPPHVPEEETRELPTAPAARPAGIRRTHPPAER
ncbi:peptidoglycan-binding protein, partial [Streptomyces sp. SID161]|nr:peptidoglycan-binding protein [Streptomyces sp. SID161]